MAKKFPLHPRHPERICWGCDKYCPVDALECGNGSDRTQHPVELLGEDWLERLDEPETWERVDAIPDSELWAVRQHLKRKLVFYTLERTRQRWMAGGFCSPCPKSCSAAESRTS